MAGREYTLIPNFVFWDWEQMPDGSYETLTISSFDIPETREAFGAMVRHDEPVLIRMKGATKWLSSTWTRSTCNGSEPADDLSRRVRSMAIRRLLPRLDVQSIRCHWSPMVISGFVNDPSPFAPAKGGAWKASCHWSATI